MIDLSRNGYSHEEIRNVLHMKYGSRLVRFRYLLLDKDENEVAELKTVESGTIEMAAFAVLKRTAKFKLKSIDFMVNNELRVINWNTDRIQVFVEFKMPDGGWINFSLGIFLLSSPVRREEGESIYREVEAYDKLIIPKEDKVTERYTIRAGTSYHDAMVSLLESTGVRKINIENSEKLIPNDKEYDPGTEKLRIFNDLASDLNFTPLWVDEFGFFRSFQYRSPQEQPSDYVYRDDDMSVTANGMEEELDLFDLPNVFTVVVANPDNDTILKSTFENTNPNHPRSIPRLGRRVVRFEEKDDIADQEALDSYVERLAAESSQVYGRLKFTTAIMPFHSYFNVLRIRNSTLGINEKYSETNWKIPLVPGGEMTHEVRRVVNLT